MNNNTDSNNTDSNNTDSKTPTVHRAFVAGATGYTGQATVQALVEQGVLTVAHVRPDSPRLEAWRTRFAAMGASVDETPWAQEPMTATMQTLRPTVVFGLLGTTKKRARAANKHSADKHGNCDKYDSYDSVDYGLSVMLLRAVEHLHSPKPRYVYLSSLGVREGTRNAYLRARACMEKALQQSKVPSVIVRPSVITGTREASRPAEKIAAVVIDACLSIVGALGGKDTQRRYRAITAEALAERLVNVALNPSAQGVYRLDELW